MMHMPVISIHCCTPDAHRADAKLFTPSILGRSIISGVLEGRCCIFDSVCVVLLLKQGMC